MIQEDNGGTTVYIDTNKNGILNSGEKSLKEAGVTNAPANGADLSYYRITGKM